MSSSKYCLEINTDSWWVRRALIEKAKEDGRVVVEDEVTNDRASEIFSGRDSGIDMFCRSKVTIPPGETVLVSLGVKCKMIDLTTGKSVGYYLYPRSSIYKTPLRLVNSVGIIDKDYRGELMAPLQNNPNIAEYLVDFTKGVNVAEKYTYSIKCCARLVQICAPDLSPLSIKFVDELDKTDRGSDGFGSTGI
tara:strand:- start:42 stop:617 length:576 start_codon:yes stop_codon:yes gene_type:complete